jgi:predicted glutamine amidotransferase
MCGIVGVMADGTLKSFKAFADLLQVDVIRGPHSTGVAAVTQRSVVVHKSLDTPTDLLCRTTFERKIENKKLQNFAYLGHNRLATKGQINRRNAHPFQHGHITGMHNGTLYKDIVTKGKTFGTDSEGIIYAISKRGIDAVWEELDGAAALMYWDNRDKTLNIITNGRRPLSFAASKDAKMVLFASEGWMVTGVAGRHDIELDKVWKPNPHMLFSFQYDSKTRQISYSHRKLKEKSFANFTTPRTGQTGAGNRPAPGFRGRGRWDTKLNRYVFPKPASSQVPKVNADTGPITQRTHKFNYATNEFELKDQQGEEHPTLRITSKDGKTTAEAINAEAKGKELSDPLGFTKKFISEDKFLEKYHNCFSCNDSLVHDYDDCVIIDDSHALCSACVETAKHDGMNIFQLALSIH